MDEFLKKLNTPVKELWANNRVFLILAGILILIIKFHSVIFDFIVSESKKLLEESKQKDAVLRTEENQANSQANELIKQSNDLDKNKTEVDEDWHKK